MSDVQIDLKTVVARLDQAMAGLTRRVAIRRLYARIAAAAGASIERPAYLVLKQLVGDGPSRITDLAADHGVEASTMSRHVRALEKAGLVARRSEPADGRVSLAEPTAAGRKLVGRFETSRHRLLAATLAEWDEADAERFVSLFERFVEDVDTQLEER